MNKFTIGCGGIWSVLLFVALIIGLAVAGSYNRLVGLQQNVDSKWADVQTQYQRRTDLVKIS